MGRVNHVFEQEDSIKSVNQEVSCITHRSKLEKQKKTG
jgi:hypothetical protein